MRLILPQKAAAEGETITLKPGLIRDDTLLNFTEKRLEIQKRFCMSYGVWAWNCCWIPYNRFEFVCFTVLAVICVMMMLSPCALF